MDDKSIESPSPPKRRSEKWNDQIKPFGDIAASLKAIAGLAATLALITYAIVTGQAREAANYLLSFGGHSSQFVSSPPTLPSPTPAAPSASLSTQRDASTQPPGEAQPVAKVTAPQQDALPGAAQNAPPFTAGLLRVLGTSQGSARYDELNRRMAAIDQSAGITAEQAQSLLGPVRDTNDRKRVIITALLPKLITPMSPVDASRLLSGLSDYDRFELLDAIQRCISRPISVDAQAVLLQGIAGAYRSVAARKLDEKPSCPSGFGRQTNNEG